MNSNERTNECQRTLAPSLTHSQSLLFGWLVVRSVAVCGGALWRSSCPCLKVALNVTSSFVLI